MPCNLYRKGDLEFLNRENILNSAAEYPKDKQKIIDINSRSYHLKQCYSRELSVMMKIIYFSLSNMITISHV